MKDFLRTARVLLSDLASSLVFIALFSLTHNAVLSACIGVLLGIGQIASQRLRRKPVDRMEWISLFLVIASALATVLTDDPRFVLIKPSVIYIIVGIAMLKPGWMNRYLPLIAQTVAADVATFMGFAWAGLMFFSAALSAYLGFSESIARWALTMAIFGFVSKTVFVVAGIVSIRMTTRRRIRAMPADEREALFTATGWYGSATAAAPTP